MDVADNLSKQLKNRREDKGLSQKALAAKVEVSRATINRWETSSAETAMLKDIKRLAVELECKIVDLLDIEPRNNHDLDECLRRVSAAVKSHAIQIPTTAVSALAQAEARLATVPPHLLPAVDALIVGFLKNHHIPVAAAKKPEDDQAR